MKDVDPRFLVPLEVDARTLEEIDRVLRVHVLAAATTSGHHQTIKSNS